MIQLASEHDWVSQRLQAGMQQVSTCFASELLSDLACVNDLATHIEQYRGKMLRPTLVLLSAMAVSESFQQACADRAGELHLDNDQVGDTVGDAAVKAVSQTETQTKMQSAALSIAALDAEGDDKSRAGGGVPDAWVVLATVTEMVHMATLVHDDILDDASMRRRGATLNFLHGNEAAVMLGDYLISHAYHLCGSLGQTRISRGIAAATNTVCEGELLQLSNRNNWQMGERTYFEIVRRKTAALTAACCRLSAQLVGANESQCEALNDYGMKLGVAFQIVDDLLDLTGDADVVGKSLGRDLAKGKLTLPVIRFLETADDALKKQMVDLLDACHQAGLDVDLEADDVSLQAAEQVASHLQASDALPYTRQWAVRLAEDAKTQLTRFLPDTPVRAVLLKTADQVVQRDK